MLWIYLFRLIKNDEEIISHIQGRKTIVLLNKTDLDVKANIELIKSKFDNILFISAKNREGIDELKASISGMFFEGDLSFNNEIVITNARHKEQLSLALDSLNLVKDSVSKGMPEDFFSIDLLNAYDFLGNIIGASVDEDLIDEIFEKFCMGK